MSLSTDHPKPWRVVVDKNKEIVIVDNNGINILRMTNHPVLIKLNNKRLSLARKIVRLMNDAY